MQSVLVDGAYVFLSGVRASPNEPFRYLRIPADGEDSLGDWMRMRAALANPAMRERAARRYAAQAIPGNKENTSTLREQLQMSAARGL